ncbi:hypothetical protein [Nitrosopumilus sp.]|uniref:hypothetical protein n=1 Tax=Nitrosopumilus sp. TaxID=2024843 RepID=UPI00292E83B1|nr:hypothetical protein [Nitrosopumilus sp.]
MSLQSIFQDLEIQYYAMMSRVVQFTRKNTLKNTINVEIPRITLENTNAMTLIATNTKKKIQGEAVTAA